MKVTKEMSATLENLIEKYEEEVISAQRQGYLKDNTSKTYLLHSKNFIKWCNGNFEPGGKNKPDVR